jgi:translation initiation factor 5A
MKTITEVRGLREGNYIVIEEEPCKIVGITISKPGKHGEAKARIDAVGLFDNQKRSIVYPVKHRVEVPIIDKRTAQILSIRGKNIQLMDLETYETFELLIPEEFADKIEPGKELEYIVALDKKKIVKV